MPSVLYTGATLAADAAGAEEGAADATTPDGEATPEGDGATTPDRNAVAEAATTPDGDAVAEDPAAPVGDAAAMAGDATALSDGIAGALPPLARDAGSDRPQLTLATSRIAAAQRAPHDLRTTLTRPSAMSGASI